MLLGGCCWNSAVVFTAFIFNECGASTEQDRLPEVGDGHVNSPRRHVVYQTSPFSLTKWKCVTENLARVEDSDY